MITQTYARTETGDDAEGASGQGWQSQEREEGCEREAEPGAGEGGSAPEAGEGQKRVFVKRKFDGYKKPIFDLTGLRSFMLVAVSKSDHVYTRPESGQSYRNFWNCVCDCGNTCIRPANGLMNGQSKSCGCSCGQFIREARTIHDSINTPTYKIWAGIRKRCFELNCKSYARYGARGITMCDRWKNGEDGVSGFECFLLDVGERPSDLQIERIDNNGNYEPSNCRWATRKEQCRNRRNSKFFEWRGENRTIPEIAEMENISLCMLYSRVRKGMSVSSAIQLPKQKAGKKIKI